MPPGAPAPAPCDVDMTTVAPELPAPAAAAPALGKPPLPAGHPMPSPPFGPRVAPAITSFDASRASSALSVASDVTEAGGVDAAGNPVVPKARCSMCNKKTGLTGFECKCGRLFCGTHRHADVHACTFDFKSDGRALIEKLNPRVVASKVDKL
jgi:hypothetical protein